MFELFIRRPILSIVISILIVFVGLLSIGSLPITQFPDIVPPSVTVRASYTGANADVMTKAVATPLERAINGVPGMTYMTTVCTNDGISLTTVYFTVGVDPDVASVNVQNRVTTVLDELPEEVIRAGVVTEKEVNSMLLYLNIVSSDPAHTEKFIYNFADINILKELKRIDGVGFAAIMGNRDYAMRVWLNPSRLASYKLSPQDVTNAIRAQNVEAAPGKTGISSDKLPQSLQYVLRYTGKFTTPEDYGAIVVKALPDGSLLHLRDIAEIEFDSQAYNMISSTDNRPSAAIMIKQRPGSNARDVINNIKEKMAEIKGSSFAPGMDYNFSYDVSRFLDASIESVIRTLLEACLLVFIVVFIFLQDFRSTMIPAIAVPVSLIGTFAFMQIAGFSINLLTLFALVLAIGIVVDNAIVVVEAVHVKMHDDGLSPYEASVAAMKEIGGAIVAITLVMSAVFVPVGFLSGTVGIFYKQFSLTLAVAIVISGINALTLSPALCALMLKKNDPHGRKGVLGRFFDRFNTGYARFEKQYSIGLSKYLSRRFFTYATLVVFFGLTILMGKILPSGFIPNEDQGMIYVNVETPPGATLERSEEVMNKIQEALLPLDEVETISTLAGYSLMTETEGANFGMGMINLTPWSQRDKSASELMDDYAQRTAHITDAEIQYFLPPTVPGFGNASGFELRLLDRTDGSFERTAEVANDLVKHLNEDPRLRGVVNGFNPNYPQYLLKVDLDRAAKMGVDVAEAMESLQTYIGSFYSSNFIRFGQMYKVMLQAAPQYRVEPESIYELFAKDASGNMVAYSNFMSMERVYGPNQITRYNLYTSAMITGDAAQGVSSGQALEAVEEIAAQILPRGYSIEWSGVAKEEKEQGNQAYVIFAICLIFVYLLLAAQYESFWLPLPVIVSLPAGVFGSFLFLKMLGLDNNIYAQVALVMLIGLLGKNAILIIEMANQYRQQGASILEAALKGSQSRLRPILMTSFAFIFGLIPLAIASGAGALGNRSIGTAAVGGMLIGTLVGIFLIPGLYMIFEAIETKTKKRKFPMASTAIIGLLCFAGCKAPQLASTEKVVLPPYQTTSTDTVNIGQLTWKSFFPDTILQRYIETALENSSTYTIAMERVNQSRSYLKQSKAAFAPQVGLKAGATLNKYGRYTQDGIGNSETLEYLPDPYHQFDLRLGFQWELNVAGKLTHKKRAALARYQASNEALAFARTQLIFDIATSYYELVGLDCTNSVYKESIRRFESSINLIDELVNEGIETQLAHDQFATRLLDLREKQIDVMQQIKIKERAFCLLLGLLPTTVERITFAQAERLSFPSGYGVPAQLLIRRPDIREAELVLMASKADVSAARASFFPSVILGGGASFSGFDLPKLFTPAEMAYDLAAGLTAPIFNRREIRTLWETSKSEQRIALKNYRQCVITAYTEVLNASDHIASSRQRVSLKQEEVQLHLKSREDAVELFRLNFAGFLEVLSAQERCLMSELEYADLQTRYIHNQILLYKALGGGSFLENEEGKIRE